MGKVSDSLYGEMNKNRTEGVIQYNIGMEKLMWYIDGLKKSTMINIGGTSGSGKTSFVLYCYVYRPIMECIRNNSKDLTVIIFCLEMTAQLTLSKLLSFYLWDEYGIEMGMRDLYSYKGPISPKTWEIINESKKMVDKMETYIRFVEGTLNAKSLEKYIVNYYSKKGSFVNGKFVPKNPNHITLGIIDHIGEVIPIDGNSKKTEIDNVADACKRSRNDFGMSWAILQQINRGASSTARRDRYKGLEMDDFKESGNVCEKSDIVLGIYYPFRMKDFDAGGYNVRELKQILKIIQILKGRFGEADIGVGCAFYGHSGCFYELPKSQDITDYSTYLNPRWTREKSEMKKELLDMEI